MENCAAPNVGGKYRSRELIFDGDSVRNRTDARLTSTTRTRSERNAFRSILCSTDTGLLLECAGLLGLGVHSMRARQLLDGSAPGFPAETMDAVNQAFANAWAQIAPQYIDAKAREEARLKLAECVLAVTRDGTTDAEQIERLALTMFRISN